MTALPSAALAQHRAFRSYGPERGLLDLGVMCLQQDRTGFILVCTENGAFRFDGRVFERYGVEAGLPAKGVVYDLKIATDGHVFVTFGDAVYVAADQTHPRFVAAQASTPIDLDNPPATALIGSELLFVEHDRLFAVRVDPDGKARVRAFFSDAFLRDHPALTTTRSVMVDQRTIWLGCGTGQICRVRCSTGIDTQCSDVTVLGAGTGLPEADWTAILRDHTGRLWARSPERIAVRQSGSSRFTVEPVPGGVGRYIGRPSRLTMAEDPMGQIVTQGPAGLLIWQKDHWSTEDRTQGLPDGEIASIFYDREHSLWLGIRGQGLFQGVGNGLWENWTINDGLTDNVCWELARQKQGPLWIASDLGVDALPDTAPAGSTLPHLAGSSFAVATTISGRVWTATMTGVLKRYSPGTEQIDAVSTLPLPEILYIDHADALWIGTRTGLYRIADADAAVPSSPVRIGAISGRVKDLAEDRTGQIWLFTSQELARVTPDGRAEILSNTASGLATAPRALTFAPDGTLWIGSDSKGLQRLVLSNGQVVRTESIDRPNNNADHVLQLRTDGRGWIWVGTDRGLDVWNGQVWHHLDEDDGLLSNDLNEGSMLVDSDGSMWFGSGHGVSHLLDPTRLLDTPPLHPVITAVRLGNRRLTGDIIDWSPEPLTIQFGSLDFHDEAAIRFRYKLSGVDQDWVETAESTVRYPQLPSGHVVFSVEAIDPLRRLGSVPVSFQFDVRPPWWRSPWFLILASLGVVGSGTSLWRLRIRFLLLRQRQLEELVAIRTAEIEQAHAALVEQASRDGLTGLLNRAATIGAFERLIARAEAGGSLAVALADLDHFKEINDRHGHFAGDEVLREVSRRLTCALLPHERAGRYGGEEFILVIPDAMDPAQRLQAIRRAMIEAEMPIEGHGIRITFSFGLARHQSGDTPETMLRRADRLLYTAKNAGRDQICSEGTPLHAKPS